MNKRIFLKSMLATFCLGALLLGCQPDGVKPGKGSDSGVAGAAGDMHPTLDTICKYSDTVFFRSNDGSWNVNKCGFWEELPLPVPCTEPQEKWGSLQMYNGYQVGNETTHWLDVSFSIAYGWYCDFNAWEFRISNGIAIDPNTGKPASIGLDWSTAIYNPPRSEWKVQALVSSVPLPCFDLACKLSVTPVDVNGLPLEAYRTELWAVNENWNIPGHPEASNSQYAMHYCPYGCLDSTSTGGGGGNGCPPVVAATVCESVFKGVTCSATNLLNTTELVPEATGAGSNPVYNWSTGQHSASIIVSPIATTAYTVTVTNGTCPIRVTTFNVNVLDAACSIPVTSGGNSNNGSGGSGSSHHPGCSHSHSNSSSCNNGNHRYGCNTTHSGGNSSCNNKGCGYHCTRTHSTSRACNGGHTTGCRGNHAANTSCQATGGHKWNCSGQHTSSSCNTSRQHASGCTRGNHTGYTPCNDSHSHNAGGHEGSGAGSGILGGHGFPSIPGLKVCHVPPGNPSGATNVCVPLTQVSTHLSGICSSNGGGNSGNGGSGSGNSNGGWHGGSPANCGQNHFSGNHNGCSHNSTRPANCGQGHNSGNHSSCTHSGGTPNCGANHRYGNHSGCSHTSTRPANCGQSHFSGNHGGCSHSHGGTSGSGGHSSHHGGQSGCGRGNSYGHDNDYLGQCNANPCQ